MPEKSRVSAISLLPLMVAITLFAYTGIGQATPEVHYGAPVNMGNGNMRTYPAFDTAGLPMELGVLPPAAG